MPTVVHFLSGFPNDSTSVTLQLLNNCVPLCAEALSEPLTQSALERSLAESWLASQAGVGAGAYVMPGTYPSANIYSNPSGYSAPRPTAPQLLSVPGGAAYASGAGSARQSFAQSFESGLFKQPIAPPASAAAAGLPLSAHTPHSQLYGGAPLDEPPHSGVLTTSSLIQ